MTAEYDHLAEALKSDDPLYVDPIGADELGLDDDAARAVSGVLQDSPNDIYIAVLPKDEYDEQGADQLHRRLGGGTYLVIYGDGDRTTSLGSTDLVRGDNQVQALLDAAVADADGVEAALVGFVDQVDNALAEGSGTDASGNDSGGSGGWLPLGILAAAGGGGFLLYRRNKRAKEVAQLNDARTALDEDITAYGEQLSALDLDVRPSSAVPVEARDEYGRALDLYEGAKGTSDRAERPMDLRPVTQKLEEGRWLLACVDARLNQKPVPERRPPCFFDPSHGPSTEDVLWAPRGGSSRMVPACAADAHRIGQGEDPESRMVTTADGRETPYWEAGPAYAGWAGGYYGGFLPGIMWGTMLGYSMGAPVGGGDAGGDFGGGDFGGDFGGGDFGGDFGGGDFGGF